MPKFTENQPMTIMGVKTPQTVIFKSESHKLHQAFKFKAGSTKIVQGQPVKLSKTTGLVEPYDGTGVYLGIAITDTEHPCYPGSEVTVMVEAFALVYGVANASIKPGYATPMNQLDETEGMYVKYQQSGTGEDTPSNFICLNSAEAGELIQVLVK